MRKFNTTQGKFGQAAGAGGGGAKASRDAHTVRPPVTGASGLRALDFPPSCSSLFPLGCLPHCVLTAPMLNSSSSSTGTEALPPASKSSIPSTHVGQLRDPATDADVDTALSLTLLLLRGSDILIRGSFKLSLGPICSLFINICVLV